MAEVTPEQLFEGFKRSRESTSFGLKAVESFRTVEDKNAFLEPTIEFLETEDQDAVRSWGTNLLELIGGQKAFAALTGLLDGEATQEYKRAYLYTRFFALRALNFIAASDTQKSKVREICQRLWQDGQEDYLVQAGAAALLSNQRASEPLEWLREMLGRFGDFWPIIRTLRALREYPVTELQEDILKVLNLSQYTDHRYQAIRTLGSYPKNLKILRALGDIVLTDPNGYMRASAVLALKEIGDPGAQSELFFALKDEDAEIRYQAAIALGQILPVNQGVELIVQAALNPETEPSERNHLMEALRLIDPSRAVPTEILSRVLAGEDRQRAEIAEKLLIDLGGWAAVQRLSQRRLTLNRLDSLLSDSEAVVRSTFEDTIRQARLNFYFALSVNVIIVLFGVLLVGLAIWQLIQNPENLASWILPGATGVLGVLINLVFNNPRNNAREDLTALMNVTVIFLGFLRTLNEIDATFKYAYLEDPDFNAERMRETVTQIESAVNQTLRMAMVHLSKVKAADLPDLPK